MYWLFNILFTDDRPAFFAQLDSGIIAQADRTQPLNNCPQPILSRLGQHRVAQGETIEAIASKYNLVRETLIRFNPILKKGMPPIGTLLLIPPINGMRVEVPKGSTWQDLEGYYGVRKDVLFELNGCQKNPTVVFIPGTTWDNPKTRGTDYLGLGYYPLANKAKIGLSYGWQNNPTNQQNLFHSGVDLLAPIGSSVFSADRGIVVFAGQQGNYGNLVVISHGQKFQTRYGHLSKIEVAIGQEVAAGSIIGMVGNTGQPDIAEPHLHFEVRYLSPQGWLAQDPQLHLP
jgi:murein DD-endopeptidase MepM/ murein hydrolase activator NlpD